MTQLLLTQCWHREWNPKNQKERTAKSLTWWPYLVAGALVAGALVAGARFELATFKL
jgi:hypothetical protein